MKIFVSAAEISSDLQAEKILRELIKLYPAGTVQCAGIGGPKLRAIPEFQCIEKAENLRAMGFTEVLGKLLQIKKILKAAIAFLNNFKPDLILTFDYPDFHFSLMKACAKNPNLARTTKICGIPPKVWVWRARRIDVIRELYDAVWVLFPFEKKLYEDAGIPVIYEGNPLIAETVALDPATKPNGAKPEWISSEQIRIAVMPGSRDAEIRQHLKVIPKTLQLLATQTGKKILAEIPVPVGISVDKISTLLTNNYYVSYRFTQDGSKKVLARNSLGLIKSGTSTLEAAVLGCVPVIFYRVSFVTRLIFQFLIRYSGAVGLPNILLGIKNRKDAIFPEFLGPEANPKALCNALLNLIKNPVLLRQKQTSGESLKEWLVPGENISRRVAEAIHTRASLPFVQKVERTARLTTALISFSWSTLNAVRRRFYSLGILKAYQVPVQSVLVGNLQAGGAGKTPVVIEIAKKAVELGFNVGVISRGYGRAHAKGNLIVSAKLNSELRDHAGHLGDEPVEILSAVPVVTLGLGSDREALSKALIEHGINFLIFDDGFQNLKFKTTQTILVVTDAKPYEVIFRDFLGAAAGADLILQTKGLPRRAPMKALPIEWDVDSLPKGLIWLLCGVGDPAEVAQYYKNLGVKIKRVLAFPDHAKFNVQKVKEWNVQAQNANATLAVTPKDFVKIKNDKSLTVFVLKRKIRSEGWLDLVFKR